MNEEIQKALAAARLLVFHLELARPNDENWHALVKHAKWELNNALANISAQRISAQQ